MPGRTFARRAFATLFLMLGAHTMTETARDAIFLSRLPATQLPWMYLLVAVASILAARATTGSASGLGQSMLPALLSTAAVISCLFWMAGGSRSPVFLYLLYLWPAVFSSVVIVEFWRVVSDAYTITEAKRVFGWLGAGGTAGALVGSGLAIAFSPARHTTELLLVAGVLFAISAAFSPRSSPPTSEPDADGLPPSGPSDLSLVLENGYLRGVAVCLLLATITATLADYVFKSVVARDLPPQDLVRVFAGVSFGVSAGTFLIQTILVGPLIRKIGVTRSLTVLPSALSVAAAALAGGAGLIGALILRVTDGTLRYSLHRAVSELLYVPLTPGTRARTKAFIDVVSQRGGQVAASVAILAGLGIGGGYKFFAAAIALLGLVIVVVAIRLRQPYLALFRATLKKEGMETRLAYPSLDVASLSALVAAFSSDDEREVVAAMDLVASQQEVRAIPVVMLFHPSRMVILRALELFEQHNRQGFAWAVNRLRVEAGDPAIRSAALSAYARQHGDPSALHAGLVDENETVRLTALVGLVAGGWMAGDEAAHALADAAASASMAGKDALATAIRAQPSSAFEDVLVMLADTPDLGLRAQVAGTMARMPRPRFMPPLLAMLSESSLRDAARHALVATGQPALDFLAANLDDPAVPRRIRLHIPRTISRFAPAEAVPVLWRRLQKETDEAIRFKILRGLGRLIAEAPDVRPSSAAIAGAIRSASRTGLRLACWRAALLRHAEQRTPTEIGTLLIQFLADRQARATEEIFRLLGLTDTKEDFERVFRGLHGGRTDRASGRELVEAEVPPSERDAVLALMDEPSNPARLARFVDSEAFSNMTHEQALDAIIRNSNGALRTIAVRRAAELGLVSTH